MSHITRERFNDKNRRFKAGIEETLYQMIWMELDSGDRKRGMPVVSLTGPNFAFHYRNSEKLRGSKYHRKMLHVAEIDPKVFDMITSSYARRPDDARIYLEDVFEVSKRVVEQTRSKYVFLDLDLCCTCSSLMYNHGMYESLREIGRIANNHPTLQRVYMVVTFSLRTEEKNAQQVEDTVKRAWGSGIKKMAGTTYRDGAPMITLLFRADVTRRKKMNETIKLKKSDPKVAGLVRSCYPNWKGRRKVSVSTKERYRVNDYWDGGSRYYCEFVHLPTSRVLGFDQVDYEHQENGNPYNQRLGYVKLTPDVAVVENCIFQGKDLGMRIYVHPDSLERFK